MTLTLAELTSMTGSANSPAQSRTLRSVLEKMPELRFADAHTGTLECGTLTAKFELETLGQMHLRCPVSNSLEPEESLAMNMQLPGNLRFARHAAALVLLAEISLDGTPPQASELEEYCRGLHVATGQRSAEKPVITVPASEVIDRALAASELSADDIVRMDSSWELRPRLQGETTTVLLSVHGQDVWIRRTVLANYGESFHRTAIAQQALLFNAELRGVRLAANDRQIVAESRLQGELISGTRIVEAARAVAVAYRHTHLALEVLASEAEVAAEFAAVFFR